jgi:hypothetical protein
MTCRDYSGIAHPRPREAAAWVRKVAQRTQADDPFDRTAGEMRTSAMATQGKSGPSAQRLGAPVRVASAGTEAEAVPAAGSASYFSGDG